MSRVTVNEELDFGQYNLWVANADRAIKGRKGQKFLKELERALLAMPTHRLIGGSFCLGGEVCLMGAAIVQRMVDAGANRVEALAVVEEMVGGEQDADGAYIGKRDLGLTYVLAWELAYLNDGSCEYPTTWSPEERWEKCLAWVQKRIQPDAVEAKG